MNKRIIYSLLLILFAFASCKSDYEKMVEKELGSGVRQDSIFFGIYLGMSSADFYKHCFELNHQGLVTNGPENNSVLYTFNNYKYALDMNFYPAFENGRIYKMGVVFNYQAWAPWNHDLFSDKLIRDVLDILEKWYGNDFLSLKTPEGKPFWVKVTGNRQILVMLQNERNVRVEITDLTVRPAGESTQGEHKGQRPVWEKNGSSR